MPSSMVVLKVHEKSIWRNTITLRRAQSAIGMGVDDHSEHLVERLGDTLRHYLMAHIRQEALMEKLGL
jgi:hypothetical protein